MRETITVDQNNIALTHKQFSEQLIAALVDFADFVSVFTHCHNHQSNRRRTLSRLWANTVKAVGEHALDTIVTSTVGDIYRVGMSKVLGLAYATPIKGWDAAFDCIIRPG